MSVVRLVVQTKFVGENLSTNPATHIFGIRKRTLIVTKYLNKD